jgi:HD-GYP domain-containing protein (c-di-GMP phosphodiesterase class II)
MIDFSKIPKKKDKKPSKKPEEKDISLHKLNISPKAKIPPQAQSLDFSKIKNGLIPKDNPKAKKGLSQAEQAYKTALSLAEKALTLPGASPSLSLADAAKAVKALVDLTASGSQDLLSLVFSQDKFKGHYLSFNMVNVCILSLEVGCWSGFKPPDLRDLGLAAFLHDIGMRFCLEIANTPGRLSLSEFQKIRQHPLDGSRVLKKLNPDISGPIIACLEQEHERVDRSGYPKALKAEKISHWAQIIGLCDVYEALTHSRPFRAAHNIQEAVKVVLSNKNSFSKEIIKALLESIGVYPKGTVVKINTDELAYVLSNNPKAPLAPLITIFSDSRGEPLEEAREIDLSRNPSYYIV